jgi:signal transduction histidine kinase
LFVAREVLEARMSGTLNAERRLERSLTARYIIGLVLVGCLTTAAWVSLHLVIATQESTAAIVNVSGRQGMLSQRTALFALRLVNAAPSERPTLRARLDDAVLLMEHSHRALTQGDAEMNIPAEHSPAVHAAYFAGERPLDRQVREYIAAARALLATPDAALGLEHPALRHVLDIGPEALLQALDAMVWRYQREGQAAVRTLNRIETGVWLLTLVLLMLEALLIFRPFSQRMRHLIGTLTTHLETLEEQVSARTRELQAARDQLETRVAERTAEAAAARDAAEAANQIKSEFLATMSHELLTPMNAVIGMTYLALNTELESKQRQYLEHVDQSAKRLLTLIHDILDYARLDAGTLDLQRAPFRLEDVFKSLCQSLQPCSEQKGLMLNMRHDPEIPPVLLGDSRRLEQILRHLVDNAIKFTEQGDILITVSCSTRDANQVRLCFKVSDTGIGISEAQREKVFQLFFQVDGSTTRKHGGTGLGLAICKRLTGLMDGTIGVESTPGKGSTFWLSLPFARPADRSPANSPIRALRAPDDARESVARPMTTAAPESEPKSEPELDSTAVCAALESLLEDSKSRLAKRCRAGLDQLQTLAWPPHLADELTELSRLLGKYRFREAEQHIQALLKADCCSET